MTFKNLSFTLFLLVMIAFHISETNKTFCQVKSDSHTVIKIDPNTIAENLFDLAVYDSALIWFSKGAEWYNIKHDWSSYCKSLAGISKSERKLDRTDMARLNLFRADSLYHVYHLTDIEVCASIEYIRSLILMDDAKYQESINTVNQFIENWKKDKKYQMKRDTVLALFYNLLGLNYRATGDLDKTLEYHQKAIRYQENGTIPSDRRLATYYNNVAYAYQLKGLYREAIDYSMKALQIYESDTRIHKTNMADICHTIGGTYYKLGMFDSALTFYNKAVLIIRSALGPDHFRLSNIYIDIGDTYVSTREFPKAAQYYNEATRILKLENPIDEDKLSKIKAITGFAYYTNHQYEEAKDAYRECIALNKKVNPTFLPYTYDGIANCYTMLNEVDLASKFYKLAINTRIKYFGPNQPNLIYNYLSYGLLLVRNDDSTKGMAYLHKAFDLSVRTFGLRNKSTVEVLNYIGEYYLLKGSFREALYYIQQALIGESETFNRSDIFSNPPVNECLSDVQLLLTLKFKARALYGLYLIEPDSLPLLEAGLTVSQRAVDLIQLIRVSYPDPESKVALTENYRPVLLNGLMISLELYRHHGDSTALNRAFSFAELLRAAILNETMQEAEARITGHIPAALIQKEKDNNKMIYELQQRIAKESQQSPSDTVRISNWNGQLFELKQDMSELIRQLEEDYPSYYDLKYGHRVITVVDLLKSIGKNEAVIEYVLADTTLYIFAFNDDGRTAVKIMPAGQRFNDDLSKVIASLYTESTGHLTPDEFRRYAGSLYHLYNDLIDPVDDMVQGKDIIIIPDGRLSYIPFEILTETPPDSAAGYADLNFLMNSHAIGYGYSATLLFGNKGHHIGMPLGNMVAFAPEYKSAGPVDTSGAKEKVSNDESVDLPYIRDEVSCVSKLYSGKAYTGEDAVKDRFLACAGDYRILHLAMHGLIDDDNPMFSKLIFSSVTDTSQDRYLNTYEIYNMSLNADLAVLSACNTGTGKYINGEGIMSMARGFYYAGCPAIVATRWSVYDKSTEEIIRKFYLYLAQGFSKIEALKRARLDFLKTADPFRSHPRFWAAFACIGDPSPVPPYGHPNGTIILIIATMILLLTGIVFSVKRKK